MTPSEARLTALALRRFPPDRASASMGAAVYQATLGAAGVKVSQIPKAWDLLPGIVDAPRKVQRTDEQKADDLLAALSTG